MPYFGRRSKKQLSTCDKKLQDVFNEVIKHVDCSVLEGHRGEFAGFVLGIAKSIGITLRWGGDWDRDWTVMDNKFDDFPHFELIDE